jgi:spore germination protein GerM
VRIRGIAAAALALALAGCGGGASPDGARAPADAPGPPRPEDPGTAVEPPPPSVEARLYFPSRSADGLVEETREIFATTAPEDRAKQIVGALLEGPRRSDAAPAAPAGVRLRQAYVTADGIAYLDFSAELRSGMGGGSTAELLTVYAVVDSIALSVPEVRRVAILVDGAEVDTLNGHLDLRFPLRARRDLVVGSAPAGAGT